MLGAKDEDTLPRLANFVSLRLGYRYQKLNSALPADHRQRADRRACCSPSHQHDPVVTVWHQRRCPGLKAPRSHCPVASRPEPGADVGWAVSPGPPVPPARPATPAGNHAAGVTTVAVGCQGEKATPVSRPGCQKHGSAQLGSGDGSCRPQPSLGCFVRKDTQLTSMCRSISAPAACCTHWRQPPVAPLPTVGCSHTAAAHPCKHVQDHRDVNNRCFPGQMFSLQLWPAHPRLVSTLMSCPSAWHAAYILSQRVLPWRG